MSRLHLKLLRDLWQAKWQFLAICLVAALGVAQFHGFLVAYLNQVATYELSYSRLDFADVSVKMERAPRAVIRRCARIPGVLAIEGRLVKDVEVEQIGGRRSRVIGRMVTVPPGRESAVNRVRILEGRPLSDLPQREVLLEASFAKANDYRPGDRIYPKLGGRRIEFRVVGIIASPEYIYPVMSNQVLMPMPDLFGVMFVPQEQVESLFGMAGSINELIVLTEPGRAEEVGRAIRRRVDAYGPEEPMLQAEQPSNKLLQSDLQGYKPMLVIMPALFLAVAGLALSLVLSRWVQSQRGQVGFLRASGFSAWQVLVHYLEVGLIIGLVGGTLGVALGHFIAVLFGGVYEEFFTMPYRVNLPRLEVGTAGLAMALVAGVLSALGPARQAARVAPADALRGELPARPSRLVRIRLPLALAMPMRNLFRRPWRSLGTLLGVMMSVTLLVMSGAFMDSMNEGLKISMQVIQNYDIQVGFIPERSKSVLHHIAEWPGVIRVEPQLSIPIRVGRGANEKETVITAIVTGSRLLRLPGPQDRPITPLPGTVLFGDALATMLKSEVGDLLDLIYTRNTQDQHAEAQFHAGDTVRQPAGLPVYMEIEEARRRFGSRVLQVPDAVTAALLEVDPAWTTAVRNRLLDMDGVSLVRTKAELQKQIDDLTKFSRTFIMLMYAFGISMALAVTYTTADIILWERTRELATLRTLGFGMGKIAGFVTLEILMLGGLGAVLGLYPGYVLAQAIMEASKTEGWSMELVVYPQTYAFALGGAFFVVVAAELPGLLRIGRLNLAQSIRLRSE